MALLLKSYSPSWDVPVTLLILSPIWQVWGWGQYWALGYIMLPKASRASGIAPFKVVQKMSFSSIIIAGAKLPRKNIWIPERALRL